MYYTYLIEHWIDETERSRDRFDKDRPWLIGKDSICTECSEKDAGRTLYKLISQCESVTNVKIVKHENIRKTRQ
jgi:hypothetical protein